MTRLSIVATFFLLLVLVPVLARAYVITDYRVVRRPVTDQAGRALLAVRSFRRDGSPRLLVFDPATLKSYDASESALQPLVDPADPDLRATRLERVLKRYASPPHRLQNAGAARAETGTDGTFLTVDLCPSKRPFERAMFEAAEGAGNGGAVPVAVAVSGLWLEKHPEEFSFLRGEVAAGRLAVTWVNHSRHHHYDPQAPLEKNFLLAPGTDLRAEVLDLEQRLVAEGVVPSPFFRFPGLVSDGAAIELLKELSLIPIGADAWLAKGEKPRAGSFILVHGNGNEPKGITLLMPMLKDKKLHLLPLPDAFAR